MGASEQELTAMDQAGIEISRAQKADLNSIIDLDKRVTEIPKPDHWSDIFDRYTTRRTDQRFFLVARTNGNEGDAGVLGYIVGTVRGWEFGTEPCGWVFAFAVEPGTRLQGIGEKLFKAISNEFTAAGVSTIRTMVPRKNLLHMAFFRSEGMVAGPYVQLEMDLES